MGVKLNFALQGDAIVSIDDRLLRGVSYTCPHCGENVVFRKGGKREHHFSHKPDSQCSVTKETLLHFEAKHYISRAIKRGEDIKLGIGLDYFPTRIKNVFRSLGVEDYKISVLDVLAYYKKVRDISIVEYPVGDYVADVGVLGDYNSVDIDEEDMKPFVFEVFVTHRNEDSKVKYFRDSNIHYIEVVPVRVEKGFVFQVEDCFISEFIGSISGDISKKVTDVCYEEFKPDVLRVAEQRLTDELLSRYKDKAFSEVERKLKTVNLRDFINGRTYKKMNSIEAKVYKRNVSRRVELLGVSYQSGKDDKQWLTINNSFIVANERNLLYALISELQQFYAMEVLVDYGGGGRYAKAVGVNVLLPNSTIIGEELHKVLDSAVSAVKKGWVEKEIDDYDFID